MVCWVRIGSGANPVTRHPETRLIVKLGTGLRIHSRSLSHNPSNPFGLPEFSPFQVPGSSGTTMLRDANRIIFSALWYLVPEEGGVDECVATACGSGVSVPLGWWVVHHFP